MEKGLLQAILAAPEDDTAWLALADFLEEDGQDDRAELLRVRQRLLRMGDTPERLPLEDRLRALLASGVRPPVPEVSNSVGLRFALVPPGTFLMGSPEGEPGRYDDEGPRRQVTLTRGFLLGVFPVTQSQFEQVMGHNPSACRRVGNSTDTQNLPVETISFNDAIAFCATLSELPEEKKARRRYALPTEAQWEYACRAGTSSAFYLGDSLNSTLANVSDGEENGHPTLVGSYPPNAFGLFDMHGNVWQWCADRFSSRYYRNATCQDPRGPRGGANRVLRGGDFSSPPDLARSADRGHNSVDARHNYNGFRAVLLRRA
jgi:uncharacterized protein (TIGR02996 family)